MKDVKETIFELLEELTGDEIVREDPNVNLLEEDLIDSLDYVELLVSIEDELGIVMAPSEFTREEMDTPAKIIEQTEKRMDA